MLAGLTQDLRLAIRQLRRSPAFVTLALVTLAAGIAANVTMFTLVNAVLFRSLSSHDRDRVVRIAARESDTTGSTRVSYADFTEYATGASQSFTDIAGVNLATFLLTFDNRSEQLLGEVVSGNYFTMLGEPVVRGRTLTVHDDRLGASPAALISDQLWSRTFGNDPAVVGRIAVLNGSSYTIVGIVPASFAGSFVGAPSDVWIPFAQARPVLGTGWDHDRAKRLVSLIGRLQSGVTRAQAAAQLSSIAARLDGEDPRQVRTTHVDVVPGTLIFGAQRRLATAFLSVLLGFVSLVLVVACANVANLLVARALRRKREFAIRLALGASRLMLFRQVFVESSLLATMAGGIGFLAALWMSDAFRSLTPLPNLTLRLDLDTDWRVLGFTLMAILFTTVILSALAASPAISRRVDGSLKDENATAIGAMYSRGRMRRGLAMVQIAVSLVLLTGTGLFLRSLRNAQALDLGFDSSHAIALDLSLAGAAYTPTRGQRFYREVLGRVKELSGVQHAAFSTRAPLDISTPLMNVSATAFGLASPLRGAPASVDVISEDYFQTIGVPILKGRSFTARDDGSSATVAIVNDLLAQRLWPGADPIGQRLWIDSDTVRVAEVVGVARNARYLTPGEEPQLHFYLSCWQSYKAGLTLLGSTEGDPERLVVPVQGVLRRIDPQVQGFFARTLKQHVDVSLLPLRLAATVAGIVGTLALGLAIIGVWGLISYLVVERAPEIGLRVALGAGPGDIARLVVGYGVELATGGVALGVVVAIGGTRLLRSLLYDVSPTDPAVFIAASVLMLLVVLLACYLPARRAMRLDPTVVMRSRE